MTDGADARAHDSAEPRWGVLAHSDPEAFCVCGHHQDQHAYPGEAGTPCAAVEPERFCSCVGFRYGTRSRRGGRR